MAKIMDPILLILCILGCRAIILGSFEVQVVSKPLQHNLGPFRMRSAALAATHSVTSLQKAVVLYKILNNMSNL